MSSDTHIQSVSGPSTDIGAIWDAAVLRYETTAGIKIQSLAGPASADNILINSKEREKQFTSRRHDGSRLDKFRTLVRKALGPIEMWGDIVTNATKTIFPASEIIFAAAKYLISTANAVSADFDRVEEFFQELSSYLIQLRVWENGLPRIPELEEVITEVFTSVLVLCGICTKYVRTKRLVKAFRALAGEDDELKSAFDQLRKTIQREQGIVRNAILAGVQDLKLETSAVRTNVEDNLVLTEQIDRQTNHIVASTNQIHKYLEDQENALERGNILAWLSTLDFHKKQRDTHGRHCSGTGNWFLDSDCFKEWLDSTHSSTLWCYGIPGAGKSIMTSIAISHVEEHTVRGDVAIAYVYCDYTDAKLQSGVELVSSITRQLVEQNHRIPEEVKTYRDRWAEKRTYPTQEDRVLLIKDVVSRFSKTYIFVDALDECPEQNRTEFLHMLRMLEPFTHLFITSRPHLDLQTQFANLVQIEIAASSSDIQVYLESEISNNSRMSLLTNKDTALKGQIIDTISKKAAGMFLVAHFQLARICRMSNSRQVRKSLEALPTEIHDFYEDALERIESYFEEDRQLVKKTLAYVYCAKRPLTMEELSHALGIETDDTEFDEDACPEMEIVLNISAGLIRVNEKSNVVVLVHQTLQEYLAKNSSKLFHHPEAEIAKTCLTYLSMDVFEQGPCIEGRVLEQRLKDYLFLDYASHHWGHHLLENDSHMWIDLLLKFLKNNKKIASYLQVLHIPRYRGQDWHDRFPKQFSPLHVVAYWGLHWVFQMNLADCVDIDSQDSHGTTVLLLAAKYGHAVLVQMLIEIGAELDVRNKREETALYWAARSGHRSIVELLVAKGADPRCEDSEGWTALDWAVIKGYPELARLLLDRCHRIDPEYSGENKAVILAAEAGTEMTVQMLIDLGADVNWKDHFGSTALTWAIPEGHEKVVRLLLDNQADVNSRDVYDNTPLHWSLPYTAMVKLLLENGAEVDAKNQSGKTALIWSAHDGQEPALRLLLDNGADVAVQDCRGCTALHAASLRGHESIVNELMKNGADPGTKDQDGWTPLHAAALKQHHGVVRILLNKTDKGEEILKWVELQQKDAKKGALLAYIAERKSEGSTVVSGLGSAAQDGQFERVQALLETGVDINGLSACGSTALTLAVSQGQERIVQLLLEQGALVNKVESNGRSALHLAAEDGHQKITQMLVENGADVNGCFYTWTPLLTAAREGHEKVIEYLVQNGANIHAEDYYGRKAVHWIAQHGYWKTLKLFTRCGGDINATDHWNRTPLMWAVHGENLAVAKLLLNLGASLESKTEDGSTALHMASFLGDEEMVLLLLQRDASIEAKTRRGFKPLHIAAFFGHEEVVRLLLEEDENIDAESHLLEADDENDEDEGVRDGSVDTDDIDLRATLALDKYMYQCLVGKEKDMKTSRSWTAYQLAAESGNREAQRLLRRAFKA